MTKGQFGLLTLWSLAMAGSIYAYFQENDSAAASEIVGTLSEKTGQVDYRRPNFSVWTAARMHQGFEKGTFVATAKRSTARIRMGSQHVIDVAEDSQVVIGNPEELGTRSSYFVGVLKGNLKVEAVPEPQPKARPFRLAALGLNEQKNSGIVIQSGSVATSVDGLHGATLSIRKELNKEAEVRALRGGALIKNLETGMEEIVGSLPTPEPRFALGFLKFDSIAPTTPEPIPMSTPKPPLDTNRILNAFKPQNGTHTRTFVTFFESPQALTIPIQFRTADASVFGDLERMPEVRVAFGGALSGAQFKLAKNPDFATLDHDFSLPQTDVKRLIESGSFETEVSPAIVGMDSQSTVGAETSQHISITNLNSSLVTKYAVRLQDPKMNTLRHQELPNIAEVATAMDRTDAIFIPRSRESAVTTRRLIVGSRAFQIVAVADIPENRTSTQSQKRTHFGRNRTILATLETPRNQSNLALARSLQKSLMSDYFYVGEERTILSSKRMSAKNWESIAQHRFANVYCAGKSRQISGKIIKDFSKSRSLIEGSCTYIFEGETAPQVFEQRE